MADQDSGDKTEQPTPKKLEDARKKGQVPKSKDLTSTIELLVWFALCGLALNWATTQLMALMNLTLRAVSGPFTWSGTEVAQQALHTLLSITAATLLPVAAIGMLIEFLQAGPVFAIDKITPKFENLNPVEGLKRLFTMDNIIEVIKSLIKTFALAWVGWLVVRSMLPTLIKLPWSSRPELIGSALWSAARPMLGWALGVLAMLSILDVTYQRFSFTKKMRMSRRDIKQEMKDNEGDPYIKMQRRQIQQEWSQRNATNAARQANALIVNPTHVAIAIEYDRELCPVPTISAKGRDDLAMQMRDAAQDAGVPVIRNISLARDLLARAEVGDVVPQDLFAIIADVILWAREAREVMQNPELKPKRKAPGEDLTRYPHHG
jgi:type III secretion protein U